jgi:hypothetical protein
VTAHPDKYFFKFGFEAESRSLKNPNRYGRPAALLLYINHLAWEVAKAEDVFAPAARECHQDA